MIEKRYADTFNEGNKKGDPRVRVSLKFSSVAR